MPTISFYSYKRASNYDCNSCTFKVIVSEECPEYTVVIVGVAEEWEEKFWYIVCCLRSPYVDLPRLALVVDYGVFLFWGIRFVNSSFMKNYYFFRMCFTISDKLSLNSVYFFFAIVSIGLGLESSLRHSLYIVIGYYDKLYIWRRWISILNN